MMEWVEYMTSDAVSPMANLRRQNGRDKAWRVPYFGLGNEPWGCGGNMRAEYYADELRKYNTFIKNYDRTKPIARIAAGANSRDYTWTEVLMDRVGRRMNLLSVHYYTLPTGNWNRKGTATGFGEEMWFSTLERTLVMDELLTQHGAVMDKSDPEKRVGLAVDEWGTWYDVEPGTEPGFLYQQNTLRDAVVTALNFHIFHKHAARVTMTNIAQTVNVLQAMILTSKERMLRTPTYWVFEMFKEHQGGTSLPIELTAPDYTLGQKKIPMVSASATRAADKSAVHVSLVNTSPSQPVTVVARLTGVSPAAVTGRILTAGAIDAHNTFDAPDTVKPVAFSGASLAGGSLTVTLPARAVVILTLK
jgi:alpha-N-arabinofuranosidase